MWRVNKWPIRCKTCGLSSETGNHWVASRNHPSLPRLNIFETTVGFWTIWGGTLRVGQIRHMYEFVAAKNFPQIWSLAEMYISVGAKSELAGEAEPNQFSTNSAWTSQYFSKFYIFQSCILSLVVQSDTSSIFHRKSEYNSSSRRYKIAWANFSKTKSPTGRRR